MLIREIIKKIDSAFLNGALKKFYHVKIIDKKSLEYRTTELNHSFVVQYMKRDGSEINQLCDKYGSDKGGTIKDGNPYSWPTHNYADFYESLFRLRKDDIKLVIECGIGTSNPDLASSMGVDGKPGASLRVWRDYFRNAKIIGADIDNDILFSEDRIKTYKCDQTDSISIKDFATKANLVDDIADIIIDDGLHEFHAGKTFFEGMIRYLAPQGVYVIEDVNASDFLLYKDYFIELEDNYATQFVSLYIADKLWGGGNRLIVVRKK
jgi:hypothetical protein